MEKNQEFYQNKKNYGDICVPSRDDVFTHLIKERFLSEFSAEEDKEKVLENLGIIKRLQYIFQILGNKADISLLNRYVTETELLRRLNVDRPRDEKSKGFYPSLEALNAVHPTGEIGDWAIVDVDGDWYIYTYGEENWIQGRQYLSEVELTEYAKLTDLETLQGLLISGTNIKTINGQSILGEGDLEISGGVGGAELSNYVTKQELYNVQYPLKVKLSATPDLGEFTGEVKRVTLSIVSKKGDTTIVPDSIIMKQDSNEPIAINSVHQIDITKKGTTTFEVTCVYGEESVTETIQVNFVLPTYIGFNTADLAENVNLNTLSKRIKSDIKFNESIQNVTPRSYLWVVSPFIVNKVALDPGFTYNVRMLAMDNREGLYYYRSSSAIDVSHLTYYIK